ncbi:MAG TPA: helix-turn-helix domain-containing protein [Spirochaetota bacterium]|nr:helix-turn-helix domain-containing protein [Spirochaetota bacterium]HPS87498.1 helix-turn-helix domain-containing protein [Spirochaetota bacterium]
MELTFTQFIRDTSVSMEDICRDFYLGNRETIRIKKEAVAVKNLATILNTTLRLSVEMGFQSMTLRDLSRESKLSMGALYNYFSSKDELFKIIHLNGMALITNILIKQIEGEKDHRLRLKNAVRIHLYLSEIMPQWFYFLYMETKNLKKEDRKIPMESELFTEKIFIDILKEGTKSKIYLNKDPLLTASMIKAMLQDWYLKRWKYTKRKVTVDQYASFMIEFIESYIKS